MHIYYYYKDGYYFVMNEKGVLEKYSVINNIELILKQENIIQYFTKELNEECHQFRFKTFEELTPLEKSNFYQIIPLFALTEYNLLQENTFPIFIGQASILNIINKIYSNKKNSLQKGDSLLEDLLKELLEELTKKLEVLKQISNYNKKIIPLSELDLSAPKTYITNINDEINSYKTDIDIQMDLILDPENIFDNNEYDKMIEYEVDNKLELEYQRKIKITKEKYLKELPEEVQTKLDITKSQDLIDYLYLFANGSMTVAMILQLIKQNLNIPFLTNYQDNILTIVILLNIICYSIYHKTNKAIKNTNVPTLKLEKKDK